MVEHTPVLAGVCGTDPFMMPKLFLKELQELGFSRHPELPDRGPDRGQASATTLEETGHELRPRGRRWCALAREMDLLTTPYVFNTDEAR